MTPNVLVVEDDEAIAELLTMQLASEGFGVRVARDGASSLKEVAVEPPDVVLLDVMMPDVDGWSVLRQLRTNPGTARIPVIMLTSRVMPADEIRGRNLGATAYLTKPYEFDALLATLHQVLGDQEAE